MKHYLPLGRLCAMGLAALAALTAQAQDSYETAIEATTGSNTYTVSDADGGTVYWKYTATDAALLYITDPNGGYVYNVEAMAVNPNDASATEPTTLMDVNLKSKTKIYPVVSGQTIYISNSSYEAGELGINIAPKQVPGLGKGLSADDAMTIELDTVQYLGNAYDNSYSRYTTYATYTATEDGVLNISMASSVSSLTVNGTKVNGTYSSSTCTYKFAVENGQTYNVEFQYVYPFIFSTTLTHPTAGSFDLPFTAVDGENKVPAEAGTYYYTYTPSKKGYLNISSDEALEGGQVKLYTSASMISYGMSTANSETGSFNLRKEVATYTASTVYYIEVTKATATTAEQTFSLAIDDYAQGETDTNPLIISEVPATITLANATGKAYYKVSVPANTNKFLQVAATGDVTYNTMVYVYRSDLGYYGGANGNGKARLDVSATEDQDYLIYWNANETTPVTFTVSYEDIQQGATKSDPLTAVLGTNTIPADGTWYYTYTPTQDCKLNVAVDNYSTVDFPDLGWSDVSSDGTNTWITASAGTAYIFSIADMKEGETFTLSEGSFGEGESMSTAIEVNDTTDLPATAFTTRWYKHTVQNTGMMTLGTDAPYMGWEGGLNVSYQQEGDYYGTTIMDTATDPETGDQITVYYTTIAVNQGETIYLSIESDGYSDYSDYKVFFAEREAQQGETYATAYELNNVGDEVTISDVSNAWLKVAANGGDIKMEIVSGSANAYWYGSVDDILLGNASNVDTEYSETTYMPVSYTITDAPAGDVYVYLNYMFDGLKLKLIQNGDITLGITDAPATDSANTAIYSLGGVKVYEGKAANAPRLAKGIYIQNGQKVVVK